VLLGRRVRRNRGDLDLQAETGPDQLWHHCGHIGRSVRDGVLANLQVGVDVVGVCEPGPDPNDVAQFNVAPAGIATASE
jgi:hypothetical protein